MSAIRLAVLDIVLTAPNLLAQSLLSTVPVANYPQAIAVNPFTNRVYTLEEPANQITELDATTGSIATISLGANSQKSLNGALAIDFFNNKIYAVDGVNNHLYSDGWHDRRGDASLLYWAARNQ
jgi:DNA-binding beta-propeller fold protein YncE